MRVNAGNGAPEGGKRPPVRALALPFVALLLSIYGCGGKSPEEQDSMTREGRASVASPRPGSKTAAPGVPTSKGGDNSIQRWGLEASSAQRTRLTDVVQAFLDARAKAEWDKACTYLAARQRRMLEALIGGSAACARAMGALAANVPADAFAREAEIRDVLSLRIGGGRAFLIYTRPGGKVYATALRREGGTWKVVSVGPVLLS